MELIKKTDTCITYHSQEIVDFPTRQAEYRSEWLSQWVGDDQGRHEAEQQPVASSVHLVALIRAVENLKGGDSYDLCMYAISNDSEYMVEFLKGRGDFNHSLAVVSRHFTTLAKEVGEMKGYEYIDYGYGWEIKKVK